MRQCQYFNVGGINTTEMCTLKCEMCFFHGKKFAHQQKNMQKRTLERKYVEKFLYELPKSQHLITFAGLGELLLDPNAFHYLRLTKKLGFIPVVLSNASFLSKGNIDEILEAGVRTVIVSADACSEAVYEKIRLDRANFKNILEAMAYLKEQKTRYPDLVIETNNILMDQHNEEEFVEFWKDKVDFVNIAALMPTPYTYINLLSSASANSERVDCIISAYLLPSGKISPCCTITMTYGFEDLDWLPDIRDNTPLEAYSKLLEMYYDESSPLREHCKKCMSWIRWHPDGNKFFKSIATPLASSGNDDVSDAPAEFLEINLFVPNSVRVQPVICGNNPIPSSTMFHLKNLAIRQREVEVWRWDKQPQKTFDKNIHYYMVKNGMIGVSSEKQQYRYLWLGEQIPLREGQYSITIEGGALEGRVAFGFLDALTGEWLFPTVGLPKCDGTKLLTEFLFNTDTKKEYFFSHIKK